MHISDGVLPTGVAIGAYAASFMLAAWSIKQVKPKELPKVAVVTSSFFAASLIHFPLGPTSIHFLLPGIVGVLLGNASFISVMLGVVLQSLLFQYGGLTALGANAIMMGVPALICGFIFNTYKGSTLKKHVLSGGFCGVLGTAFSAVFLALFLASAGEDFLGVAQIALAAHVPIFFIEGFVSASTVSFLFKVKPEMLQGYATLDSLSKSSAH